MKNYYKHKKRKQLNYLVMIMTVFVLITGLFNQQANGQNSEKGIIAENIQEVENADLEKIKVSVNFENISLDEAILKLGAKAGLTFNYNGELFHGDRKISYSGKDVTVAEALQYILPEDIEYITVRDIVILQDSNSELLKDAIQETVTGQVTDAETGESLIGVSILIKDTEMGTATDADGTFELTVPSLNETLVFSYIGYQPQEVELDGRTEIEVQMISSSIMGEELIVVGYGTQQRAEITGSVNQVSGSELAVQPSVSTAATLMGKVPGLQVIQSSGQPGANHPTLRIRGTGTLGNSSPLILIDGVEGSLNDVPSSDVESVSVLKDASAAAIYGSRAANGVILVTTKRGLEEGLNVNYRGYLGVRKATNHPEFTDAGTFMRLENEALTNVGSTPVWSDDYISEWEANYQTDPDRYPNTDWVSEVYSETAYQMNHNLSISGGTERIRYRGSLGFDEEQGEIPNHGYQRYDVRLNTDVKASEKIDFSIDLNLQRGDLQSASAGAYSIRRNTYRIPSIYPAIYSHGGWAEGWNNDNPVAFANDGGVDKRENYDLRGRFNARIQPVENLEFNVMYSPYYWAQNIRNMSKRYAVSSIDSPDEIVAYNPTRNSLRWQQDYQFRHTFNTTGEYIVDLANQSFKILGGFEYVDNTNQYLRADRQDFDLQDFEVLNAGSPGTMSNSGTRWGWALASFFGRLNYNFLDKYLFEANLRYDGSSRFAEENRWGLFPSFSAGWIVSEESFMNRLDFISNLKFRASWGQLGNQEIGTYPFASLVSLNRSWIFNGQRVKGAAQTSLANQQITWETTTSQNIGVDLGLLEDRIYLNFDYFQRRTEDILLRLPVPRILGKSAPTQNAAVVDNKGWELEAGFLGNIGTDFSYDLSFNISDVKNEVIDLRGAGPFTGIEAIMEGEPIDVIYGYESDGLFQSQSEVDNHADQFGTVAPGDIRYVDQNGDGVINEEDRVVIGDPFPRLSFGINLSAQYKNFDFSAFIQGVGKRDAHLRGDAALAFYNGGKIADWQAENYWTPGNTNASYPRLTHASSHNNFRTSDYWVFDASYLRLRNLQVGYSLPPGILEKISLSGLRVFFQGQNLFTFSPSYEDGGLPPGIDPNIPSSTLGGYYPVTRLISGGIEINF